MVEPDCTEQLKKRIYAIFNSAELDIQNIFSIAITDTQERMLLLKAELTGALAQVNINVTFEDLAPLTVSRQVDYILNLVAKHFGISYDDLLGRKRQYVVSQPRNIAIYLIYRFVPVSFVWMGNYFDKRDHTTMVSARNKIEFLLNSKDENLLSTIKFLEAQISFPVVERKPHQMKSKRLSPERISKIRRGVQLSKQRNV